MFAFVLIFLLLFRITRSVGMCFVLFFMFVVCCVVVVVAWCLGREAEVIAPCSHFGVLAFEAPQRQRCIAAVVANNRGDGVDLVFDLLGVLLEVPNRCPRLARLRRNCRRCCWRIWSGWRTMKRGAEASSGP